MVADLILQLQIKFPKANIISQTTGQIGQHSLGAATTMWVGGLLYVDDLALFVWYINGVTS